VISVGKGAQPSAKRQAGNRREFFMQYKLGRLLQFLGLFVILPLAMAGNMMDRLSLKDMLLFSAAGVGVFYVGYLLQQSGGQAP
jgi:hypothetical protein